MALQRVLSKLSRSAQQEGSADSALTTRPLTVVLEDSDGGSGQSGPHNQGGVVQLIAHYQRALCVERSGVQRLLLHRALVSTLPTRAGMLAELVAYPIPKTRAAGLPTNRATSFSRSLWMSRVPAEEGSMAVDYSPGVLANNHV